MDVDREAVLSKVALDLGYAFENLDLLELALTHRSAGRELGLEDNERLEFLGDAVLELAASRWLFERRRSDTEGLLTQRRSRLVSAVGLKRVAERIALGRHILLSAGEDRSGGRSKRSVLANTVEALLGAIYLDGGLGAAEDWILPHLQALESEMVGGEVTDPKNRLQELLQRDGGSLPRYSTVAEEGPAHAPSFVVECWVGDRFLGSGSGSSKKEAQRRAAQVALEALLVDTAPVAMQTVD